jgi:predicted MFS family arabinose efflux permease
LADLVPTLSNRLVAVMAIATGAIVANLYYAQPLLHEVASTFGVGSAAAALVVTCTQVGYAAGLILVVPLGDLYARRPLVPVIFCLAAISLVLCAAAPSLWLFEVGSVAAGATSVAGQVMVPFAADLASPERRGRVVARIMTGLLTGILLARTVSGAVAEVAGWRAIYWISAGLMILFAFVLWRVLPGEGRRPHVAYRGLVASAFRLLVDVPMLRRRAFYGACVFAGFSVLWTSLAFLLSGPPYDYSNVVIGLFGLAGVAGVAAANLAGKLADSARTAITTLVCAVLLTGSFALLAGGKTSLGLLLAGIVVLDMGTQGMQITNQAVIYSLRPEARSRINSAYMFCYFVGGALGSLAAGLVLAADGWPGVCWLGAGFGVLSLGMVVVDRRWPATETVSPGTAEPTGAGGVVGPPGLSAAPTGDVATFDADDLDRP